MELKAEKILAAAGPTKAHQAAVGRSWFGTLLGQSVVLVFLLLFYVAGVGLLWRFMADDLFALRRAIGELAFWVVMLAPLAFIALFSMLPTALHAARERRLRPLADNPKDFVPGYFRLYPYGAGDTGGYVQREDLLPRFVAGMAERDASVFYLSGASGVGKSSLVQAEIVPAFEARGWKALDARGLGNSYAAIVEAIGRVESLLSEHRRQLNLPDPSVDTLEDAARLVERTRMASETLARDHSSEGLLIVVDQFEEFLILEDDARRAAFADLLAKFASKPVPRVKLLLVFREDYRALLFKQGLPDFVPGTTGFELAPFTRAEAEAFLKDGPRVMDADGYDALFRGLDRVEEARGLYRPITLNMVGLVLQRTGARLADDPARLVERYLADCLARGRSRDFAKQVLASMITEAGTKEAKTAAAIAAGTGLPEWQVRATLVDLEQDALVRPLPRDGLWEVSHDFLARLLGQLLGRLKPPALSRAAPLALALAALGWAGALGLAAPLYFAQQREAALSEIRELGFNRLPGIEDGAGFVHGTSIRFRNSGTWLLRTFRDHVERGFLRVTVLDFPTSADLFTDLAPLTGLPLTKLNLNGARFVTDLSPLAGMPLSVLDLSGAEGVTDLSPLAGMELTTLYLSGVEGVTDLSPLAGMELTTLYLNDSKGVTDLSPLTGMPLTTLDLSGVEGVTDLSPLAGMPLRNLDLSGAEGVTDLSPLAGMDVRIFGPTKDQLATFHAAEEALREEATGLK